MHPNAHTLKLIQDVTNTMELHSKMYQRLFTLKSEVSSILVKYNIETFTVQEWNLIESYVKILEPVEEISRLMEGDKYTTVSL